MTTLDRVVRAVQVLAGVATAAFVILLFTNEPPTPAPIPKAGADVGAVDLRHPLRVLPCHRRQRRFRPDTRRRRRGTIPEPSRPSGAGRERTRIDAVVLPDPHAGTDRGGSRVHADQVGMHREHRRGVRCAVRGGARASSSATSPSAPRSARRCASPSTVRRSSISGAVSPIRRPVARGSATRSASCGRARRARRRCARTC